MLDGEGPLLVVWATNVTGPLNAAVAGPLRRTVRSVLGTTVVLALAELLAGTGSGVVLPVKAVAE